MAGCFSMDADIKCFDEMVNIMSSPEPVTLLGSELECEHNKINNKDLVVKSEVASPVYDMENEIEDLHHASRGLQLERVPSDVDGVEWFIKREVTSPSRDRAEEMEDSNLKEKSSALNREPCEIDSKEWIVKTEFTSPAKDTIEEIDNPYHTGLCLDQESWEAKACTIKATCTTCTSKAFSKSFDKNKGTNNFEEKVKSWRLKLKQVTSFARDSPEETRSLHKTSKEICLNQEQYIANRKKKIDKSRIKKDFGEKVRSWRVKLKKVISSAGVTADEVEETVLQHGLMPDLESCFQCRHCQYKMDLVNFIHDRARTLQCPFCELTASLKSELKCHIESMHMKGNTFQCPHCEYRTIRRDHVIRHIESVHKKEKAFQCADCEYRASRKSHLKRHIDSVHKRVKAFHCPLCEYSTSYKSSLKAHINSVHLKEKAFHCPHCEYRASLQCHMKRHIDSVHMKLKAFQCPYCEYRASRKIHLNNHMDSKHKRENNTS